MSADKPPVERTQNFDRDPGWEGVNNRSTAFAPRQVKQDFGYSPTQNAGGRNPGEMGGVVTPSAEPAFYARKIGPKGLKTKLAASGVIACDGPAHVLVGFFNAKTLNEWRTPNTLCLRIQGRGDVFYAYLEYATRRWRAGGDNPRPFARVRNPETGREEPKGFAAKGASHAWTLAYDPDGENGRGVITATIDGETSVCVLDDGHIDDGATFDRFGLLNVMKSADSPGEVWLDDIAVNGEVEAFDEIPIWDCLNNRKSFESANVRPRFDFGFSPTNHAGGTAPGELGGLVFRGDCREPARMAAYGDRVGPLGLDRPIRASGKLTLRRAVSDSTTLFGFYHSKRSLAVNPSQSSGFPEGFLGFAIEGPSREGFFAYPVYRTEGGRQGYADGPDRPRILPDGKSHDWTLSYDPAASGGRGRVSLTLDGKAVHLDLGEGDRPPGAIFDRFGLVTTWIDGNGQSVYLDDLAYTASH